MRMTRVFPRISWQLIEFFYAEQNFNWFRVVRDSKKSVQEESKQLNKRSIKTHFSYSDDYLANMPEAREENFKSTRATVASCNDVLQVAVIRD